MGDGIYALNRYVHLPPNVIYIADSREGFTKDFLKALVESWATYRLIGFPGLKKRMHYVKFPRMCV